MGNRRGLRAGATSADKFLPATTLAVFRQKSDGNCSSDAEQPSHSLRNRAPLKELHPEPSRDFPSLRNLPASCPSASVASVTSVRCFPLARNSRTDARTSPEFLRPLRMHGTHAARGLSLSSTTHRRNPHEQQADHHRRRRTVCL